MNFNNAVQTTIRWNAGWILRLTALWLFPVILLYVDSNASAQERPDAVFKFGNDSDPVFEFQERYRGQSEYSLKIYADGKVVFHGYTLILHDNPVQRPAVGEHYNQITRQQVNELSKYFLALSFKELKKYEEKMGYFEGSIQLIFFRSTYVHIDMLEPLFFKAMMAKIKKITDIQKWVCYPKGHPQYGEHCLEDLPEDLQF